MTTKEDIINFATMIKGTYGERDDMVGQMEDMYLLKWAEEEQVKRKMKNVKITLAPEARNQAMGAVRLLSATWPTFSMPASDNELDAEVSEKIEKWCEIVWGAASRARSNPVHYDMNLSGILWSEIYIGVTSTADLVKLSESGSPAHQARAKKIAATTPYLFEVYRPDTCYPQFDDLGLARFYREFDTDLAYVRGLYGEGIRENDSDFTSVTLCDYWDLTWRMLWVKGDEQNPIIFERHGLPFIPIVATIVEGSQLFEDEDEKRQPFLYTVWKSGLWNRLNLSYTVNWTNIFAIGANPLFIHKRGSPDSEFEYSFDIVGGVVEVPPGDDFYPMLTKGITDPALMQALEVADKLFAESTIFKQTLGEPLGSNAPFSMVALLSQSGRLPLVMTQRKVSWAMGDILSICLQWWKLEGREDEIGYSGETVLLEPDEIPETFTLEASLDMDLPQDRLQQANIANMLGAGPDPMMSRRYVREEVLNQSRSEEITKEIWNEQAAQALFQDWLMGEIQKNQMQRQMEMQQAMMAQQQQAMMQGGMPPGGQPGMPPQGMPPGGQGMPPQQQQPPGFGAAQPPPGMVPGGEAGGPPFFPGQGGIPPEMAMGGMQPPQRPPGEPPIE